MASGKDFVSQAVSHYGGQSVAEPKPQGRRMTIPNYTGLKIAGWLLIILGFIILILGFFMVVACILTTILATSQPIGDHLAVRGGVLAFGFGWSVLLGVGVFITGIWEIGMGQLLLAVRDMARNSFRRA